MAESRVTNFLLLIRRYYTKVLFTPIQFMFTPYFTSSFSKKYSKLAMYFIIKALQAADVLQVVRLILISLYNYYSTGILDGFDLTTLFSWLISMTPIFCCDYAFFSVALNFELERLNNLFCKILSRIDSKDTRVNQEDKVIWKRLLVLFLHNLALEYFSIVNFPLSMINNLDFDPKFLYYLIPVAWRSRTVNTI